MRLLAMVRDQRMRTVVLAGLVALGGFSASDETSASASEPSTGSLQEQGDRLMKNVEEMVAHGGMGDAKAIIHHCGEATRIAETILAQVTGTDPSRGNAVTALKEVVQQCRRVSDFGIHADPGQLLNPAIKARTAARESIKSLGLKQIN